MDLIARSQQNSGTTAVRDGFQFDVAALEAWLAASVHGFAGPLTVEQFKGGQSNPTYKLITAGATYVLRSKPPGTLLKSAHAIDREYRVLAALGKTAMPVPHVHGLCTDDAVLGRWFYVMDFTPGIVIWDLPSDRWRPHQRGATWRAGIDAVIALHGVDVDQAGLRDFGKTGGYVARQLKRWSEQYAYTRDGIENPAMDRLIAWLHARVPEAEPTTIVHGDLQLSNMILLPDLSRVGAVIDWELSTLGNPISDLAYFCRDYHMPVEDGGFGDQPEKFGIPPEAEIIARYVEATGTQIKDGWMIYVVFNMFRLAAIRQGVAKRIKDGTATSPAARQTAKAAVTLANRAWVLAQQLG